MLTLRPPESRAPLTAERSRADNTVIMSQRAKIVPKSSATIDALRGTSIAVLGYGSQGSAHALNLRDSGCDVIVAQRASPRRDEAIAAGFEPVEIPDAVRAADLLIFGLPDDAAPEIFRREIAPQLRAGQCLGFLHGFVIHYQQIEPPTDVDVILVAPKAQGRGVRNEFVAGRGVAALISVHQDAGGKARARALGWAAGIGSNRAGIIETTFADETETDLFGEQAVLCGGLTALIKAGFETLVDAGYPPELAYFECCHEIKLLADLIYEHGINGMRARISSTARFGDLTRGPRVADERTRSELREILGEIRSGAFARELIDDNATGRARSGELLQADAVHPLERVGAALRKMMWERD